MGYAQQYAPAIMRRGRIAMEPVDFTPDWGDAPRKGKFYPGVDSLPLPVDAAPSGTADAGLSAGAEPGETGFTLSTLAGMLHDSYALLGRRLGVQANTDLPALPSYAHANWFRGTASGGGLYPCSIYWICGPNGPVTPGIYYYSTQRHAMQPLALGDASGEVRAALGALPEAARTDQFLVVGIKYWQNAFKYNSFAYHAVTMDVGTTLQTWTMWARAEGLRIEPALWFDEQRLARLLALPDGEESVFAVVPLAWQGARGGAGPAPSHPPVVTHADRERSHRVFTFDSVERMHTAASGATVRPDPGALRTAAAAPRVPAAPDLPLPAPALMPMSMRAALRRRRSSFGRFEAARPISSAELAALLATSAGTRIDCDVNRPDTPSLSKLYAFVNHVDGVPPGAYEYEAAENTLRLVKAGPPGEFVERNYFLANYNLEQAAAVLVPTVRTAAVLAALGDRGYHLVNATIGAIAQACYTASAALDIGCGVALGFDNISYIEELDLADSGEQPLLIMLVGHERSHPADFRYELV
ncbi:SagB family peptide dehydrogenase [Cryptosporangium minutisporangium]|uniref:Nitroreductase domain-containing protein n=1 Tax=Cryptosporangium minutisporangium TaxID=113569 RepID=A0ABP6SRI8_9ACTN